jgi:hypothetical protein
MSGGYWLKLRIRRLERLQRQRGPAPPAADPGPVWTPEERAQAVFNVFEQACGRTDTAMASFDGLEGKDFLVASWPWFVHVMGSWPVWAQEAVGRIGGSFLVQSRLIDRHGAFTPKGLEAWNELFARHSSSIPNEASPMEGCP